MQQNPQYSDKFKRCFRSSLDTILRLSASERVLKEYACNEQQLTEAKNLQLPNEPFLSFMTNDALERLKSTIPSKELKSDEKKALETRANVFAAYMLEKVVECAKEEDCDINEFESRHIRKIIDCALDEYNREGAIKDQTGAMKQNEKLEIQNKIAMKQNEKLAIQNKILLEELAEGKRTNLACMHLLIEQDPNLNGSKGGGVITTKM